MARFGAGPVLASGLMLMTAGLALFTQISVGGNYVEDFLAPGLLTSVGIGLSIVPSTIAATATAAPSEAGLASGLVNTSRQMGGALGLAILASVSVLYTEHLTTVDYRAPILALTDGFRLAFLLAAAFAAVGAVIAVRFIPRTVKPLAPPLAPVASAQAQPAGTVAAQHAVPQAAVPQAVVPKSAAPQPAGHSASVVAVAVAAAPAPDVQPDPPEPARRPAPAPAPVRVRVVSSVAFSVPGGERWAIGAGSMTVRVRDAQGAGGRPQAG